MKIEVYRCNICRKQKKEYELYAVRSALFGVRDGHVCTMCLPTFDHSVRTLGLCVQAGKPAQGSMGHIWVDRADFSEEICDEQVTEEQVRGSEEEGGKA